MQPPWIKYPDLPNGSIGWRMGYGEDYYNAFYRHFSRMTDADREQFEARYPEPAEWSGLYGTIKASPWN